MTNEEARGVLGDVRAYLASRASLENEMFAGHTFTDICNAIKALEQTRWIPIGEKLPNEYEYVFVSGDNIVKHAQFIDGRFDCDDIEKFIYATIDGKDVIGAETFKALAWMPVSLPEPYKSESEE